MPNSKLGGHYSQAYDLELQQAAERLLQMAKLTQQQLSDALSAFASGDVKLAQQVKDFDRQVNSFEVDIDEHCLDILARRQPAASDLRLVLTVLKGVNDIERVGDLAKRIAKSVLKGAEEGRPSQAQLDALMVMAEKVQQMLQRALDAFKEIDAQAALSVLREDKSIDDDYAQIIAHSLDSMKQDTGQIGISLQVSNVAKALERVGDHSRNLCQHTIFLARGRNVAYMSDDEVSEVVGKKID